MCRIGLWEIFRSHESMTLSTDTRFIPICVKAQDHVVISSLDERHCYLPTTKGLMVSRYCGLVFLLSLGLPGGEFPGDSRFL